MRYTLLVLLFLLPLAGWAQADSTRFVKMEAGYPVRKAVANLEREITKRGLTVFAVIDHGANAAQAEMELPPTVLILFGNPKAGTRLMQADPRIGLELPLKMLVWEEDGKTWIGYTNPLSYYAEYDILAKEEVINKVSQTLGSILIHATQ